MYVIFIYLSIIVKVNIYLFYDNEQCMLIIINVI
jgi:hypothetical protein